jgi:type VI secretion system protein ImpM
MSFFRPQATGYFGKLPARGDFLRAGLPEDFVAAWDGWCREMLAASRAALGAAWEDAWMQAPIWRFLLPAGACGGRAVLGVWLPSMDKVGRHFPLVLAALADCAIDLEDGGAWLAAAEAAGLAGVVEDAPHENFAAALAAPVAGAALTPAGRGAGWWTEGSPLVQPKRLDVAGLLPVSFSGEMLRDVSLPELP